MLIDFREKRSKVPQLLEQFKIPCQIADLKVDYIINKNCFIERKTTHDFIASIENGRLFKQVTYLAGNCLNPLLILEGVNLYEIGRMNENSLRGVMIWISLKKKVPVIRTVDEYDTASIIRLLVRKYGSLITPDSGLSHQMRVAKTFVKSDWQRQLEILTQIPGIGRDLAKDLLAKFGSIANIIQATDADLTTLPYLGKNRLSSIRQLFPRIVQVD